jgi:putative membrane protein
MDFATTDLVLAILHHLLVFMLAGALAFEIGTVSVTMKRDEILGVGRVDNWYGILAVTTIVVGFIRATVAAKGWAYYEVNLFFWAKIATFVLVGLLSIVPTVAIIRWQCAEERCRFCSAG